MCGTTDGHDELQTMATAQVDALGNREPQSRIMPR